MKRVVLLSSVGMMLACAGIFDPGEGGLTEAVRDVKEAAVEAREAMDEVREVAKAAAEVGDVVLDKAKAAVEDTQMFRPYVVAACQRMDACECMPAASCVIETQAGLAVMHGAASLLAEPLRQDETTDDVLNLAAQVHEATVKGHLLYVSQASCEELACDDASIDRMMQELEERERQALREKRLMEETRP